ncbi:hypothetical protein GQ53DRAFT_817367 [Thozetella sp. PMI_491]|nr:hypothetical protein GQ53DRAFT_817367 [Thozetella sp. PMI_491]
MKFFILIYLLCATAFAASSEQSWFDGSQNVTCTTLESGSISCQPGHIDDAPLMGEVVSALQSRNENALEKRLSCRSDR